jgi:hypothetical protein
MIRVAGEMYILAAYLDRDERIVAKERLSTLKSFSICPKEEAAGYRRPHLS